MQPIRIACVSYLNTAPLIEGLDRLAACTLIPTVPSRIAGMVQSGEADIGLASIIDAPENDLALLPVGMIGCDGPTLTVRIFSRVPMEEVREVAADTESHTSIILCRILFKRLFSASPAIIDWTPANHAPWTNATPAADPPDTVLLIGDKVVTDAPPASHYPHQLDLGEAWKSLTGLPFVYAMWMCRADRAGDEHILRAAALLDRQRRHNRTRMDWIVSTAAPQHHWPTALAARYLGFLLRFEVTPREREAVELFLSMAAEDGLVRSGPGVRWVDLEPVGTVGGVAGVGGAV